MIASIVSRAMKYVDKVVVADDGSINGTSKVAEEMGAIVVRSQFSQGFGKNVKVGLSIALSNGKPDIVVTLDGDGQHDPDEIPQVVAPIIEGRADLVIGSRFLKEYKIPKYRKIGIDIITGLYNWRHKDKLTDGQSCFRAYKREVLESIDAIERGFGFSTEILIKARAQGFRIVEVPVSCIYHKDFKMNSSMNPIKQGVGVALSTIKWRFKMRDGGNKVC